MRGRKHGADAGPPGGPGPGQEGRDLAGLEAADGRVGVGVDAHGRQAQGLGSGAVAVLFFGHGKTSRGRSARAAV